MNTRFLLLIFYCLFPLLAIAQGVQEAPEEPRTTDVVKATGDNEVYVIPVEGAISKANFYIIRRGFKQAADQNVGTIILDINTPGGRVDYMLEIFDLIDRYDGTVLAYVNPDAISAGAFICMATDDIYFAPNGTVGAAGVITGGGEDLQDTLKLKIESYLKAKVRSSEMVANHPYRADVLRAMVEADFEFKIGDEVIKEKNSLLTLTAKEAVKEYGDPAIPLLGSGIAEDIEGVLALKGVEDYNLTHFEITWSEHVAKYMEAIAPLLMAVGFLCLLIEFKTPGFGLPGIIGIILFGVVFLSNNIAGLAGHETFIIFILGFLFVLLDLLLLGVIFLAAIGLLMMFGALLWSLADIWPEDGLQFDPSVLYGPFAQIVLSMFITIILAALIWRFLPKGWMHGKIILTGATTGGDSPSLAIGGTGLGSEVVLPEIGATGITTSFLRPSGEVEIDGKRYQATCKNGSIDRDVSIRVTGISHFTLIVEKVS